MQQTPIRVLQPAPHPRGQHGVAILIQSQRCACLDATDSETQLLVETGRLLQASGVAVLMVDMPHATDPTFGSRAEAIWARQKRILSLFQDANARYPEQKVAVLAIGESAQCVEALLRQPRAETSLVSAILLADVPKRDACAQPLRVVSDCMDFRAQVEAASEAMWREVLAESYAGRIFRSLDDGENRSACVS